MLTLKTAKFRLPDTKFCNFKKQLFVVGASTIMLAVWTSPVGMLVCSGVFGFFSASFGPVAAEVAYLITGPRLFNFAYGYLTVIMGLGWLLGAPAAGSYCFPNVNNLFDLRNVEF